MWQNKDTCYDSSKRCLYFFRFSTYLYLKLRFVSNTFWTKIPKAAVVSSSFRFSFFFFPSYILRTSFCFLRPAFAVCSAFFSWREGFFPIDWRRSFVVMRLWKMWFVFVIRYLMQTIEFHQLMVFICFSPPILLKVNLSQNEYMK